MIFSRTGIIILLLLVSAAMLFMAMSQLADLIGKGAVAGGIMTFNALVILWMVNTDMDSSAKITWILLVAVTSFFGAMFYLYTKSDIGSRTIRRRYAELRDEHRDAIRQDEETLRALREESPESAELYTYLNRNNTFPVYSGCRVTYYPLGEDKFRDMIVDLESAERFIFLEYFIIADGNMWGTILAILKRKAAEGVDVRLMYDGTDAISNLPYNYPKKVEGLGIKCKMFSPLRPFVSTHYNYRDHRKFLIVDGKIGYNGGINLADEYINAIDRFGHWKDTAVRVQGPAVQSMTLMFLNMWSFSDRDPEYDKYLNPPAEPFPDARGYVLPYGFNPFDRDRIGEKVYMDILNRSDRYVHMMSPYLIPDDELLMALKYTAERGVDVKLILPGIPDKKMVYALAKTWFRTLLDSDVEVYLYTPGFVHAKVFVADGLRATVGTINLDYRSLYHHFECGTYMYGTDCIPDIEADFQATLAKCQRVTYETIREEKFITRLEGRIARLVAPML